MENKLQQLTKKLYDEGLEKGRSEAGKLVEEARAEADRLLGDARAQAEKIVAEATRKADELAQNTRAEVALAARRSVAELKEQIAALVSAKALAEPVKELSLDAGFLKELIGQVAQKWDAAVVTLPGELEAKFDKAARASLGKVLGEGVELRFASGAPSGFSIAPREGGYRIDFTQERFKALVDGFLRPKVAELLWQADQ